VEEFYAARGLPATFWITDGMDELDGRLAVRGYERVDPTLIMTAPLAGVDHAGPEPDGVPSAGWLDAWWSVDGRYGEGLDVAREIVTGVPAGYVMLAPQGADARGGAERGGGAECGGGAERGGGAECGGGAEPGRRDGGAEPGRRDGGCGVGRGVVHGEWVSIWCMATTPPARRQGVAGRVLRALLAWGARSGASRAYLVVTERNAAARALYEGAGFAATGHYHYRVGPLSQVARDITANGDVLAQEHSA
jgi:ribosomal protein S18 acetylase RimI-like enzyme